MRKAGRNRFKLRCMYYILDYDVGNINVGWLSRPPIADGSSHAMYSVATGVETGAWWVRPEHVVPLV